VPAPGPYTWDFHLPAWVALAVGVGLVVVGHRRLERRADPPIPWTRRQMTLFAVACGAAVVALTWPVADLAAHWSLIALVTQRLILLMAVAPMLLLGLPYDLIQWATRPAAVDTILVRLQRPPVAIATVTVIVIGSMTPLMVRAQASSFIARGAIDLAIVAAGMVLWIPVLGRIPGLPRAKPVVRFGYLVAQAVIPAFLSFVYIFSRRPLYPEFARSHAAIGLRPLNDQQIAGFVSKLTMLFVLLIVGAVVLSRAPRSDEDFGSDELVWADVERQFERVDRQGTREVAVEPEVGMGSEAGSAPPEDSVPEHRLSEPGTPEPPENEPPER
jgi:cytochrome c oxidase assembly factor CtaG